MLRPMVPGPRLAVASLTYGGKGERGRGGKEKGEGDNISIIV